MYSITVKSTHALLQPVYMFISAKLMSAFTVRLIIIVAILYSLLFASHRADFAQTEAMQNSTERNALINANNANDFF